MTQFLKDLNEQSCIQILITLEPLSASHFARYFQIVLNIQLQVSLRYPNHSRIKILFGDFISNFLLPESKMENLFLLQ